MKSAILAAAFATLVFNCCTASPIVTRTPHEKRSSNPQHWHRSNRVDRHAILPVRIGLTQGNLDNAEAMLMDVSDPASPNFGKHWTQQEVHDKFAPSEETVQAVRNWLIASGIKAESIAHSDSKGWLALHVPAWQAEDLFQAHYYEYEHSSSGTIKVGSDEYYVAEHVREHVDFISPGVKLSVPLKKETVRRNQGVSTGKFYDTSTLPEEERLINAHSQMATARATHLPPDLQTCGTNMTPICVKALYSIPDAYRNDSLNSLGIYERADIYLQKDLDLYFEKNAPHVPKGTHPVFQSVDGGLLNTPGIEVSNVESNIDFDIAFSLLYPQTITLYQVDDNTERYKDGGFNTFLDALDGSYCNYTSFNITGNTPGIDPIYPNPAPGGYKGPLDCGTLKPTRVISVSYGVAENDAPANYTRRQCNEFLKLGLQGHTILYASGDFGVASGFDAEGNSGCLGANGTVTVNGTIYNPTFPTCPYVTSVGGTRLFEVDTVGDAESALEEQLVSSAGGFANYFPVPTYQKSAVADYFQHHDPGHPYYEANDALSNIGEHGGLYNRAGRGIPDVSANGGRWQAFSNGTEALIFGTSLSAPIWASIITLINQERTAVGKGPVGFINPTLYANPGVMNDIRKGGNPACGSDGFTAVEGWDPVTGLGTPNYPKLLNLFIGLP